ncbi:unnamed protein product [Schistocephalus solidus]|uniref:SAC3/GANP/THP3 conserved domain-containing protein n=1 Tax=Schistocephalus solidus TaxID=70667 RepID=A0A3P7CJS1_SCHSO|nr:unnamed protein product [Schistocephalus solidus]
MDQADTALSTPSNVSSYPSAVPAATPYMYPLYTPAYAGLSAVDAASRWNALNCSYVSSQPTATDSPQEVYPTTPVPGVQSKPFVSMSGPRFPLKGSYVLKCKSLDSGKTGGAASYTVYAGPKPQSAPSTATSPSSLSESAGGENRWSPELKEYVRRAFCSTDNDVEKNQMERILREKLEYVFRNKIQIDWTKEPIPTVPSKSLAAILAAGQSSSVNSRLHVYPVVRHTADLIGIDEVSPCEIAAALFKAWNMSPAEPEVRRGGSSPRGGTPRSKARGARGGRTDNSNYPAAPSNNATPAQAVVRGGKRGGRGKKSQWSMAKEESSQFRLNQRANRFKEHLNDSTLTGAGSIAKSTSQLCLMSAGDKDDQLLDFHQFKVAGTSEELEKPYLRLTSAPDPSNVRPGEVLVRSLDHVLRRWKEKNDYHWVCEQLKSIRQDLIIQGIQTEFTAKVYEAHADIALDAGDFEEFHQCQSQLLRLHSENLGLARRLEFSAYRLLYYIFTLDFLGISTIMASFRSFHKENPHIKFALKAREAWALRNYRRFFQLACPSSSEEAPPPRGCIQVLAWSLPRERKQAIKAIFKTYRPTLSLSYVAEILGFYSTTECSDFLVKEMSIPSSLVEGVEKLDCKEIWSQICQAGATEASAT